MSDIETQEHIAIIESDERGRFHLRKFLGKDPGAQYRVYVDTGAGRLTLERVDHTG